MRKKRKTVVILHKQPYLDAIDELITYYKGTEKILRCPLCILAVDGSPEWSMREKCQLCPWVWFTGMTCEDYAITHYNLFVVCLRDYRVYFWVKDRLEALSEWKELIEAL